MSTNAGTKKINLQGDVKKFRDVWYDPTQINNIFGLSPLSGKQCITYDNSKEYAFMVHSYNVILKSNQTNEGLHAYRIIYAYVKIDAAEKSMHPPART